MHVAVQLENGLLNICENRMALDSNYLENFFASAGQSTGNDSMPCHNNYPRLIKAFCAFVFTSIIGQITSVIEKITSIIDVPRS